MTIATHSVQDCVNLLPPINQKSKQLHLFFNFNVLLDLFFLQLQTIETGSHYKVKKLETHYLYVLNKHVNHL